MTAKTRTALAAEIASQFPTNVTGSITATILRGVTQDMVDSSYNTTELILDASLGQMPAATLKANPTGNVTSPTSVTLGTTLSFVGTALQTGAGTGDVTWPANGFATTLASSGVTAGSYGTASSVPTVTFDAKGRATGATNTAIAIASAAVTDATALATPSTVVKRDASSGAAFGALTTTSISGLTTALSVAQGGTGVTTAAAELARIGAVPTSTTVTGTGALAGGGALTGNQALNLATQATGSILSNISGSTAVPSGNTLTALIDNAFGSTQGVLLYRGASGWAALAPSTAGYVLQTGGTGANPAWAPATTPTGAVIYNGAQTLTPAQAAQAQANIGVTSDSGIASKFRNGTMDVWQRGTSITVTAGTPAYTADGWIVSATGANVTAAQVAGRALTAYALQITGAASNTAVNVSQRIESAVAAPLAGQQVTVQAWVYNGTGASLMPTLTVSRPTATDNYGSTTTDVSAVALQACPAGTWTQVARTFAANAGSTAGLQVALGFGAVIASQTVRVVELDIRATPGVATGLNALPPTPELRPMASEIAFCQRYLASTYNNGVAPGTTTAAGLVSGTAGSANQAVATMFPASMFSAPVVNIYDRAGNAGKTSIYSLSSYTDSNQTVTIVTASTRSFQSLLGGSTGSQLFHYFASAEL